MVGVTHEVAGLGDGVANVDRARNCRGSADGHREVGAFGDPCAGGCQTELGTGVLEQRRQGVEVPGVLVRPFAVNSAHKAQGSAPRVCRAEVGDARGISAQFGSALASAGRVAAGPDAVAVEKVAAVVDVDRGPGFVDRGAAVPGAVVEAGVVVSHLVAADPVDRHARSVDRGVGVGVVCGVHRGS